MRPIRHHITTTLAIAIAATAAAHATTPLLGQEREGPTKWEGEAKQGTQVPAIHLAESTVNLDIPAGPLTDTLRALGTQANINIVYDPPVVADRQAPQIKAQITAKQALATLLKDTGLTYEYVSDKTVAIKAPAKVTLNTGNTGTGNMGDGSLRLAQNTGTEGTQNTGETQSNQNEQSAEGTESESDTTSDSSGRGISEIVVTGTSIRGVQPSSPLVTITQEEMRLSGHNNLGDAIRALPQNFNGGQNPGIQVGLTAGDSSNRNTTGGAGLNLRGLGPDATLTLLNGARLPYDGFNQATDVSVIPVAAIERVEILLDGASAIYGSDAVGGVANIVLKRDYQGAELSARYGAATDGGFGQTQYTAVGGTRWGSGGFLATGDISRNDSVRIRQREYLANYPSQEVKLYPDSDQTGVLLSGHQELGRFAELTLDAFYTERQEQTFYRQTTIMGTGEGDSAVWGIMPTLHFSLPRNWALRVNGASGENRNENLGTFFNIGTGAQVLQSGVGNANQVEAAGIQAEGPLFALSGGETRVSVGGGYRENSFRSFNSVTGATTTFGAERSRYLYGEINLPIVSADGRIALVDRLSINGAVRHEDYESFGATTTPKIGMIWSPVRGFDVKASWGKSFKAPTLNQQYSQFLATLNASTNFPAAPAGTTILFTQGANPDLGPEHADIITAGFVARPEFLRNFELEVGWFGVDYTDRVAQPINPLSQALANPVFASFVLLNPTAVQLEAIIDAAPGGLRNFAGQPYDPARVHAVLYNHNVNVAAERVSGVDLNARYAADLLGGNLLLAGNASWLRKQRRISSTAPQLRISGRSFFPAEFRSRLGATWSRGGFTLSSAINHIDGVENSIVPAAPQGHSMTTLDLIADWQMESRLAGNIAFNVAVTNVFNQRPPQLQPDVIARLPYDATNYSALGRVVNVTVMKKF